MDNVIKKMKTLMVKKKKFFKNRILHFKCMTKEIENHVIGLIKNHYSFPKKLLTIYSYVPQRNNNKTIPEIEIEYFDLR